MKPTVTQLQEHNVALVHGDAGCTAPVNEMTYFFHGRDTLVTRNENEAPDAFFVRVLGVIRNERDDMHRCKNMLNPNALVTVYAGRIEGIEVLRKQFMREHLIECLHRESGATPAQGGTGGSRAKALGWLAQIHGVIAPKKTRVRATKEANGTS